VAKPAAETDPVLGGTEGGADTDAARGAARAALAAGNRRLKNGDVAGAIEDYRHAQELYPPAAAKIEFNIAKAEEARHDEPAAAAAFERFLAQSLEIPPEFRQEARNELHRLSAALGALRLAEKRPGLRVIVDGQARGKTPVEGELWVRPGRHVITLEEGDREMFRDTIEVEGGATVKVTVTISPSATEGAPPRRPALALADPEGAASATSPATDLSSSAMGNSTTGDASSPVWKRWWFWTAAGAVAVAAATTVILLESRSSSSDCPSGNICHSVSSSLPSFMPQ
jgi:tetratricopeptide (TPR) repeat protein